MTEHEPRGTVGVPLNVQGDGERPPGPRHRRRHTRGDVAFVALIVFLLGGGALILLTMVVMTVARLAVGV